MTPFPLKIVSPDGIKFEGQAEQLTVRTTTGDMAFLANHINCVAPLGMGCASVVVDGNKRHAACIGGMISVKERMVSFRGTYLPW